VCVFVDSGVLLHSGALAAHLECHRGAARDGDAPLAVTGYVYCFTENDDDGDLIAQVVDPHDPDGSIADLVRRGVWPDLREKFYAKYGDEFAHLPAPWLVFMCANTSARTSQLRRVGGFDPAYRSWGAEDVDLAYRLHRDGARFVLDRRASSIHYPHPMSHDADTAAVTGNYRYFAAKYGTPVAQLLVDNNFFVINDIIRERGLRADGDRRAWRASV
jgi:hypothetical protein